MSKNIQIIDCFTLFNEMDLLEIRLNVLNLAVDYFVLVESSVTQTGIPKPFYYEENKERYKEFNHKIIHVKVYDSPENGGAWEREHWQRNAIMRGLDELRGTLSPTDFVILSDLDELWNSASVEWLKQQDQDAFAAISFDMSFHAYYVNLISPNKKWRGSVLTKWLSLENNALSPQYFRDRKDYFPFLKNNAGWHLSWLGGAKSVLAKLKACVEPANKDNLPHEEGFEEAFRKRILEDKQFGFSGDEKGDTPLEILTDESILPEYILQNRDKYKHLFL